MKKDMQIFYRHLKKIGVPYKARIEFSRVYRKQGFLQLDDVCRVLDSLGISHDLINISYDDLERCGCDYYNECWLHSTSQLVCDNGRFILSYEIDFYD